MIEKSLALRTFTINSILPEVLHVSVKTHHQRLQTVWVGRSRDGAHTKDHMNILEMNGESFRLKHSREHQK